MRHEPPIVDGATIEDVAAPARGAGGCSRRGHGHHRVLDRRVPLAVFLPGRPAAWFVTTILDAAGTRQSSTAATIERARRRAGAGRLFRRGRGHHRVLDRRVPLWFLGRCDRRAAVVCDDEFGCSGTRQSSTAPWSKSGCSRRGDIRSVVHDCIWEGCRTPRASPYSACARCTFLIPSRCGRDDGRATTDRRRAAARGLSLVDLVFDLRDASDRRYALRIAATERRGSGRARRDRSHVRSDPRRSRQLQPRPL